MRTLALFVTAALATAGAAWAAVTNSARVRIGRLSAGSNEGRSG